MKHQNGFAEGTYGARLLPQVIDALAICDPERVYALVPYSSDISQGFRKITTKDLANAVNCAAWWIEHEIGRSEQFETLAYMGATDIRYGIFFFAAIKCGYKFLVPSARNSVSGSVFLLRACQCTKILCTAEMTKRVTALEQVIPDMQHLVVASLETLLEGRSEHYPYKRTHAEGVKDSVLICQTSGSTGAPKPIILPNGAFSVIDNQRKLSKLEGRINMDYSLFDLGGGRFINTFPGFHVGGMVAITALPLFYNSTVIMTPSNRPANGEMLGRIMSHMPVRAIFTPPTVLEELLETPGGLQQLAQTQFVMYGGGPLAPDAGNRISQVTVLTSAIGSTEAGIIPARVPSKDNWNYFEFHPDYEAEMVHVAGDIYELTVPNPSRLGWIHTVFHTFPEVGIWRTNDQYKQHPTNPKLFTFRGRGDDVIVLSNGEKFQPVTTESIIQGHPDVEGALVVGTGRFQPALIVEPRGHRTDREDFIAKIWPTIQSANREAAAHGKVYRGKIILTSPDKPFVRASKGTIIRAQSTALYADEIETLFAETAECSETGVLSSEQVANADALKAALDAYIRSRFPDLSLGANGDAVDFFASGLDSVQTLEMASGLRVLLRHHLNPNDLATLTARTIYAHATIEGLANYVSGLLGLAKASGESGISYDRCARMRAMFDKYTEGLPEVAARTSEPKNIDSPSNGGAHINGLLQTDPGPKINVVLTGSTGSLGMQLLHALIMDPQVSKVFCLNRAEDAEARTHKSFAQRNLDVNLSKAEFQTAQFADKHVGLELETYRRLQDDVDIIIHNAWKVDFNQSLESFEGHIRGVRTFIDWSMTSIRHPRIMFVSSVSAVGNWSSSYPREMLIPEGSVTDKSYGTALPMGYGESKHVGERILGIAAERCGVKVDILRLGQVAGPITPYGGPWNKSEWFPILIQTSKSLGCLPDALMRVDWIPSDILAAITVDLVHQDHKGLQTYNLVNPHPREWASLVCTMHELIGGSVISLKDWIKRLKSVDANDKHVVASMPAIKILDWFSAVEAALSSSGEQSRYAVVHGPCASRTMARLGPVNQAWIKLWLDAMR